MNSPFRTLLSFRSQRLKTKKALEKHQPNDPFYEIESEFRCMRYTNFPMLSVKWETSRSAFQTQKRSSVMPTRSPWLPKRRFLVRFKSRGQDRGFPGHKPTFLRTGYLHRRVELSSLIAFLRIPLSLPAHILHIITPIYHTATAALPSDRLVHQPRYIRFPFVISLSSSDIRIPSHTTCLFYPISAQP